MVTTELYFTEEDHRRLSELVDRAIGTSDPSLRADLGRLSLELRSANIVAPQEVPTDVVTLNSRLVVEDLDSGDEDTWLLTLPNQASISDQRLSVLSPLGTALLGTRVGQETSWQSGERGGRVRIKKLLFQPEAAGVFNM